MEAVEVVVEAADVVTSEAVDTTELKTRLLEQVDAELEVRLPEQVDEGLVVRLTEQVDAGLEARLSEQVDTVRLRMPRE